MSSEMPPRIHLLLKRKEKFYLPPLRVYAVVMAISFAGAFQVAYILLLQNPLQETFQLFINESFMANYGRHIREWEYRQIYSFLINAATIGGILAGISILFLPNRIGRIRTFWVCNASCVLGFSLCATSKWMNRFEVYIAGRFLNGYGAIMMYSLQCMYFTEIADKKWRGFINGQTGLFKTLGQIVALLIGMPIMLGTPSLWPIAHWLQFIPTACLSVALMFAPESPRHLLSEGRLDECRVSCRFCFGDLADVETAIDRIRDDLALAQRRPPLLSVWRDRKLRRGLLVACAANLMVAFSGIVVVNFFAVYILRSAGLSNLAATWVAVFFGCVGMVGATLSAVFLDRLGRRVILLWSAAAKCVLNTIIMAGLLLYDRTDAYWMALVVIAALAVLKFFLEGGTMQVAAFIASELVPQNAKALVQGSGTIVRYVSMSIITQIFFPLDGLVGPWSFLLFIIPLAITTTFTFFTMPETKVRDAREIYEVDIKVPKFADFLDELKWRFLAIGQQKREVVEVNLTEGVYTRKTSVMVVQRKGSTGGVVDRKRSVIAEFAHSF